jgi:hypothetical protein
METSNNVVKLDDFRPKVDVPDTDNWARLHAVELEQKLQALINEGIITSGTVIIDPFGVPHVHVVPNNQFYNVTINQENSNT